MTLKNNNIWDGLHTISSFDAGSPPADGPSETIELIENNNAVSRAPAVATPISLLVQSLVQQLCMLLEKDNDRALRLYNTICDKLHEMRLLDETYNKGEFEEMRFQYQMALGQLVKVSTDTDFPLKINSVWPIRSSIEQTWSRYYREFEETEFIAKGGFGQVFKARNKLDGVEYAVKKVVLPAKDVHAVSKHFDEVKTFASLNHPNIVPYKSAWLEPKINFKASDVETAADGKFYSSGNPYESSYLSRSVSKSVSKTRSDDFEVLFEEEEEEERESFGATEHRHLHSKSTLSIKESIGECRALVKLHDDVHIFDTGHVDLQWATLYIQMALCEKTLKTWMEDRNALNSNVRIRHYESPHIHTAIDIFTQLAQGVNYIHNLKIVHHDIKPTNIFIGENDGGVNIQLADFGLACPMQEAPHIPASGTCVYAAPEQIQGHCHVKNDLFSIGLILLELVECFNTSMEKIEIFKLLREGRVPLHITANSPQLAQLISRLAENDLKKRMDSHQLLHMLRAMRENKDETIKHLQNEVHVKNETIQSQQEEISQLKQLLALNNIKL